MTWLISVLCCPRCLGAPAGVLDGSSHQWGVCDNCGLRWALVRGSFPRRPDEDDRDQRRNDAALAKYRVVAQLRNPIWLSGEQFAAHLRRAN
jgi:hypothetical protein